jgi:hypothetical protein
MLARQINFPVSTRMSAPTQECTVQGCRSGDGCRFLHVVKDISVVGSEAGDVGTGSEHDKGRRGHGRGQRGRGGGERGRSSGRGRGGRSRKEYKQSIAVAVPATAEPTAPSLSDELPASSPVVVQPKPRAGKVRARPATTRPVRMTTEGDAELAQLVRYAECDTESSE